MKNSINLVIPTMWNELNFCDYLENYISCNYINKIILIDNKHTSRPKNSLLKSKKIELVSYGKNIYVNPAWNEGYFRSQTDVICFLNDDIIVDNKIFESVSKLDFDQIDIIGVHLKGSVDNFHIVDHLDKTEKLIKLNIDKTKPIGGQAYAFGICMFVKRTSYKIIPGLYQIWYGDDYLVQNNNQIYALKTNMIKGEISKTIVTETKNKNSSIQRRIDLDSLNAYKYNHFLNGKNWDLLRNAFIKQKRLNDKDEI